MLVFGINKSAARKKVVENYPLMSVLPRPDVLKAPYRLTFSRPGHKLFNTSFKYTIGHMEQNENKRFFFLPIDSLPEGVMTNISFEICDNGNLNNMKLWKYLRKELNIPMEPIHFLLTVGEVEGLQVIFMDQQNELINNEISEEMGQTSEVFLNLESENAQDRIEQEITAEMSATSGFNF